MHELPRVPVKLVPLIVEGLPGVSTKAVGELLGMIEEPVNLRALDLLPELDRLEPEQGGPA